MRLKIACKDGKLSDKNSPTQTKRPIIGFVGNYRYEFI